MNAVILFICIVLILRVHNRVLIEYMNGSSNWKEKVTEMDKKLFFHHAAFNFCIHNLINQVKQQKVND